MIIRIHPRDISPSEPLAEALDRPVSDQEGLTEHTVVAHWPGLDYYTLDDEQKSWTSAEWAEHLDDPSWQHPFAAGVQDDRRAIWHAEVRLHASDRDLTGPEWSEIAHRIARIAGIQRPGDDHGCRWIAVQAQPGRLDLLANLIRQECTWTTQPHRLLPLLAAECRRIEAELDLRSPSSALILDRPPASRSAPPRRATALHQALPTPPRNSPDCSGSSPTRTPVRSRPCAASSSTQPTVSIASRTPTARPQDTNWS